MFSKKRKSLVWLLALCFILSQIITSPIFAQSTGTDRISGADRYKTAVAVSQKGWKTSDYAVLARGDNFADALCAGPLAQKYDGPILLTPPNKLNSDTLKELQRLGVKHLFIAGGVGAVSQSVEKSLKANGIDTIERIYGSDRYETSVKIAEKIGDSSEVVLATGSDFPDALSISGIAAKLGMPILLTAKNSLPTTVGNYLQTNTVTQTYVVGGTGVISSEVASNVPSPSRLAGSDRYETNKVIMQNFAGELNFENIYVAVGSQFADALTGAVLAAKSSAPLVLTGKTLPKGTADYLQTKLQLSTKVKGLGGKAAVPSTILTGIVSAKEQIAVEEKYSTAGTYGPETGTKTIQGSVIISSADVTLQNTTIEGDLLLGRSIGDGDVSLRDVTVKGKTIVNGGGPNSIIMYNFNGQTVVVDVPDGSSVRLVAQGSTSVDNVSMEGNGTLDQSDVTGTGFVTVQIPAGAQVSLSGDFNEVNVEAAGANVTVTSGNITTMNISESATGSGVNLASGSSVGTLNANAQSNVTGQGQITTANVYTNGVTIEQKPTTTNVADNVTTNVDGEEIDESDTQPPPQQNQGSGDGGTSMVSVSGVTVTNANTVAFSSATRPTSVTWNGTDVKASMTGTNPYTISVPSITKTANTLVVGASGYSSRTVSVTITTSVDNLRVISSASELADAIVNQADGQSWIIKAGVYDLDETQLIKYETWTNPAPSAQGSWYFPIHEDDVQISGEGEVVLTSSYTTANGSWASQNFITVFGDNVTLNNLTIKPKLDTNKAIEVIGSDVTLKDIQIKCNDLVTHEKYLADKGIEADSDTDYWEFYRQEFSGSIIFNSHDFGTATINNVTIMKAWFSPNYSDAGTLNVDKLIIDYRGAGYAPYADYGVISGPKSGINYNLTGKRIIIKVDNSLANLKTQVLDRVPNGTIVQFTEDMTLDETLVIGREVILDGAGFSVDKAINIAADNVKIENLTGTVVDRASHQLPGIGGGNAFYVNGQNIVLDNVSVDGTGATEATNRAVIGHTGSDFTILNSSFENVTTAIFAHSGNTQPTAEQVTLTATGNTFTDVWAGIGGTEKTNLTATGNTFVSIKEGGEGIGLGSGVRIFGQFTSYDADYLLNNNTFNYDVGNKVKDYRETVTISTVDELIDAIANQENGQIWIINEGTYDLPRGVETIEGQAGWYFPITADDLSIIGVGNPVLTSSEYSVNGALASQNLITIWGNNVAMKDLTFEPKVQVNKTIEVIGKDFTIRNCYFTPNTVVTGENANQSGGGSLYFTGEKRNIVVNRNTFNKATIAFDNAYPTSSANIQITNNTWENIRGYAVGNVSWGADPYTNQYADVNVSGNSFNNVTGDTKIIAARMNGTFILDSTNEINNATINKNEFSKYINFNNLLYWFDCKDNEVIVDGVTYESPYKDVDQYVRDGQSIQEAITAADEGDTILVAAGIYDGFKVNKDDITLRAADGVTITTVTQAGTIGGAGDVGILIDNAEGVTLEGFTIDGEGKASSMGVVGYGEAEALVDGLTFMNLTRGIYANGADPSVGTIVDLTVQNSAFTDCTVGIGGTENTILSADDNTFSDIGEGIGLGEGATVVGPDAGATYADEVQYLINENEFDSSVTNQVADYRPVPSMLNLRLDLPTENQDEGSDVGLEADDGEDE